MNTKEIIWEVGSEESLDKTTNKPITRKQRPQYMTEDRNVLVAAVEDFTLDYELEHEFKLLVMTIWGKAYVQTYDDWQREIGNQLNQYSNLDASQKRLHTIFLLYILSPYFK